MESQKEIRFFTRISSDQIKLLLLFVEVFFIGLLVLCYYQNSLLFSGYVSIALLFNALTILPFSTIFKKLKMAETKSELMDEPSAEVNSNSLDMWERTCIGFYVVANSGMAIFLSSVFFNLW